MSCALMRAELGATHNSLGALTEDAVLGGALRLRQPRRGHRVGHDAVLLAAACPAQGGEQVVDLGAGVGAAGLAVAMRAPDIAVTLVEIDPDLATLAAENAQLNGLAARVRSVSLDAAAPARAFVAAGLAPDQVDRVLMNPPFNDPMRQASSPDRRRRLAHAAPRETLGPWIRTAARLLRPNGTLTLIFRADGLIDLGRALEAGFGAVTVLPVYPKADQPAVRILVRATKASRSPLALLPGLVLNDAFGRPTPQAEAVLRAAAALPLAQI
jgi:tRNA1(Val) A37 N6-methylase TrmN6